MSRQLGPDYCGPGCRGLCPCPMWHKRKWVDNRSVDPQRRWAPAPLWGTKHTKDMKRNLRKVMSWKSIVAYDGEYE